MPFGCHFALSRNRPHQGAAETPQVEDRAERRLERLEDRMARQPALEKALDARIPERQLRLDGPGMGGGSRERDYGMEM